MHFLRQPADVVMRFNDLRGIPVDRHALDYIWIQCALREKAELVIRNRRSASAKATADRSAVRFCQIDDCIFKHADELVADNFAFFLRISDAAQLRQKSL